MLSDTCNASFPGRFMPSGRLQCIISWQGQTVGTLTMYHFLAGSDRRDACNVSFPDSFGLYYGCPLCGQGRFGLYSACPLCGQGRYRLSDGCPLCGKGRFRLSGRLQHIATKNF
jgi:hypothetical protein